MSRLGGSNPSPSASLRKLEHALEADSSGSAPLPRLLAFAEERGWRRLRFLSSANNTYNVDYHAETTEGAQRPMLTVFHRDADAITHFWSSELFYAPNEPGEDPRHVGALEPLWNMLDLTPEGRPQDWVEQLQYG